MAVDRSVVVRLLAQTGAYRAEMGGASTATAQFTQATNAAGQASTRMSALVTQAAGRLTAARRMEAAAAERVAAAEARLASMRRSGSAPAALIAAQEQRLAQARTARAAATTRTAAAEARLAAAQQQSAAAGALMRRAAVGAGVLALGLGMAVKTYTSFDQAMASVKAQMPDATAQYGQLTKAVREAGKASVFSATEAAGAAEELAKAGLTASQIMGGALTGALNLAAAGSISMADAATYTAQAMAIFDLKASQANRIADVFAAGALGSTADVSTLAQALAQGGLSASQMGVGLEDTIAMLSLFDQNALKGSDAGTSMKNMFMRLNPSSKEAAAAMEDLGLKFYDANGQFIGMSALAGQLQSKLGGLSQEERSLAVNTIFGADAQRAVNILIDQGAAGLAVYQKMVNNAGIAAVVAAQKQNNLAGDFEKLKGALEDFAIGTGAGVDGPLRKFTQWSTNIIGVLGLLPDGFTSTAGAVGAVGLAAVVAGAGLIKLKGALGNIAGEVRASRAALRAWSIQAGGTGSVMSGLVARAKAVGTSWQGMSKKMKVGSTLAIAAIIGLGTAASQTSDAQENFGRSTAQMSKDIAGMKGGVLDTSALFKDLQIAMGGDGSLTFAEGMKTATSGANGLSNAIGSLATGFGTLGTGAKSTSEAVKARLKGLGKALAEMHQSNDPVKMAQAADAFGSLSSQAGKYGVSVEELNKLMPDYANALIESGSANSDAAKKTADHAKKQKDLEAAVEAADNALKNLGNTMAGMVDGEIGYRNAVDAATESVKENGRTVNLNTKAGRENMTNLMGIASASKTNAQALKDSGKSWGEVRAELDRGRADFLRLAAAMNVPTDQAKNMADQMFTLGKAVPAEEIIKDVRNVSVEFDAMGRRVYALKGTNIRIPVDTPNAQQAIQMLANVKGARQNADGSVTISSSANTADTMAKLAAVKGARKLANGDVVITTAALNTADTISKINAVLNAARSKQIFIDIITRRSEVYSDRLSRIPGGENARGGFYEGGVKRFARGGENHVAQIARGGDWRVWAEPETKGEAYIPFANDSRRPRAKQITERVVQKFGGRVQWFADGGMTGWSPDTSGIQAMLSAIKADPQALTDSRTRLKERTDALAKATRDLETARARFRQVMSGRHTPAQELSARSKVADAVAREAKAQRELNSAKATNNTLTARSKMSASQRFTSAVTGRSKVTAQFIADITKIKRYDPDLARTLLEQGDEDAVAAARSYASSGVASIRAGGKALRANNVLEQRRANIFGSSASAADRAAANAQTIALQRANATFARGGGVVVTPTITIPTKQIADVVRAEVRAISFNAHVVTNLDGDKVAQTVTKVQATSAAQGSTTVGVY